MKTGTGEIHIRQVAVLEDDITELRFFYAATDQYAVCKQAVLHTHIFRFNFEYPLIPERIFSFAGGAVILREIVDTFGVEKVIISKNGVREGYFIDRVIKKDEEKVENNEA